MKQLVKALEASTSKAVASNQPAKKKKSKRSKRKSGAPSPSQSTKLSGQVTMSHREYLGQITIGSGSATTAQGSFYLSPQSFPWLSKISVAFEKYRWLSFVVEYIPDVGTTTDGSVALGVDWGTSDAKVGVSLLGDPIVVSASYTRAKVVAMTPSLVTPNWKSAKLRLPANMLQSRLWYDSPTSAPTSSYADYAPGFLAYYATGPSSKSVGDIWVSYKVVMSGTRG